MHFVRMYFMAFLGVLWSVSPIASATETSHPLPKWITQYGCQSCHALNIHRNAPSFQSIAQRYQSESGAKNRLILKLRTGGAGAWGSNPMPPQIIVPDDERSKIIDWILAQHPADSTQRSLPPKK